MDNMTLAKALPIVGVAAGGMLLQGTLRLFSAHQAADQARTNIADGTVTFQPQPYLIAGPHGMGFGMSFRK